MLKCMKRQILQMYGLNKAPSDIAFGKSRRDFQQEKMERKLARKAAFVPSKFVEGAVFGYLELISRVMRKGYFGSRGHMGTDIVTKNWRVKCRCGFCDGEVFEVTHQQLYRGMDGCELAPKQVRERATYTLSAGHTRPPLELEKREFGRLIAHEYKMNFGWMCECRECGDFSWVRYTRLLERYGRRPCLLTCLDRRLTGG